MRRLYGSVYLAIFFPFTVLCDTYDNPLREIFCIFKEVASIDSDRESPLQLFFDALKHDNRALLQLQTALQYACSFLRLRDQKFSSEASLYTLKRLHAAVMRLSSAGQPSFEMYNPLHESENIFFSVFRLPMDPGVLHNDADGILYSALIIDADVDPNANIADTKLATITTAGKVENSATTATSSATADAIVARDASGDFSAGIITADLDGNATTATTAVTTTNFTGSLSGDVTGTQGATVVATVGGRSAADIADAIDIVAAATNTNVADTLVLRDNTGSFEAEVVSMVDGVASGDLTITSLTTVGIVHNDASGLLSSSLIVNADVAAAAGIVDTKLATISTAGKVANSATTATSANTANAIVARDASGNFSAGIITASLSGNATTATTSTNFSGSLSGDVTGTQGATVVATVGGQTAANVAAGAVLANAATNTNTANTIVRRDSTGSFAAQVVSFVDEVATGSVTITPFNTAGIVHNNASGLLSSSLIVNADVAAAAGIVDTKLATISTAGKVANSATTATSANTANAIVARDASGNFTTTMITLTGTVTNPTDAATKAYVDSAAGGTNLNTPNTIVRRDNTGSFAAQVISMVDGVFSGNIALNNSTSSTVGTITKAGSRFIHNFGTDNTFVGVNAGNFTTTGTGDNTGLGISALTALTSGVQNTAVGSGAGSALTTGSNNTILGYNTGTSTTTGSNNIYIDGSGAAAPANESTTIRIGSNGTHTRCFIQGISNSGILGSAVVVTAAGQLGVLISSQQFKHSIVPIIDESERMYDLIPVSFIYNSDETQSIQYGLIAEEVYKIMPDIVITDAQGRPFSVRYDLLSTLLLKEVQNHRNELREYKSRLAALEIIIDRLQQQIEQYQR